MFSLHVRNPQGEQASFPIRSGRTTAGSGEFDGVSLPGLGPAALEFEVAGDVVLAAAFTDDATIAGRPLSFGDRRALVPGEHLTIAGHALWIEATPQSAGDATCALARGVLAGAMAAAPCPVPVPTLVWLNGSDCGRRLPLYDDAIFLGRGLGSAARVRDAQASRRHARLVLKDGGARLIDLGSANGLFVDGERVAGERLLRGGETIRIGDTELAFFATASVAPAEVVAAEPASASAAPVAAPRDPETPRAARRITRFELALISTATCAGALGVVAVWLFAR